MKKYYGNYLGLCIDNNDPQKRGRVQIFIPHIMPALYDNWNEVGQDIEILAVGDNLPSSLPTQMVEKLKKILPWAEGASPIMGTSAPGSLEGGDYNQFPNSEPPPLGTGYAPSTSPTTASVNPLRSRNPLDSNRASIAVPTVGFGASSDSSTSTSTNSNLNIGNGLSQTEGSLVLNPDPHGPTSVINMNDMAAGMFSYPSAGAVLWVFFREGNPLHPVYFAANYGQREWASAYNIPEENSLQNNISSGSGEGPLLPNSRRSATNNNSLTNTGYERDSVGYKPAPTSNNPTTSVGGRWNVGKVGIHSWHYVNDPTDPLNNERSYAIGGHDGSNVIWADGYNQFFSKFDRRDQVEGDHYQTIMGFRERFIQGDENSNNLGNVIVRVGNTSQEALDAVNNINNYIKQIVQPLTVSTGDNLPSRRLGTSISQAQREALKSKFPAFGGTENSRARAQTQNEIFNTALQTLNSLLSTDVATGTIGAPTSALSLPLLSGGEIDKTALEEKLTAALEKITFNQEKTFKPLQQSFSQTLSSIYFDPAFIKVLQTDAQARARSLQNTIPQSSNLTQNFATSNNSFIGTTPGTDVAQNILKQAGFVLNGSTAIVEPKNE
jgi:hypothetical protein